MWCWPQSLNFVGSFPLLTSLFSAVLEHPLLSMIFNFWMASSVLQGLLALSIAESLFSFWLRMLPRLHFYNELSYPQISFVISLFNLFFYLRMQWLCIEYNNHESSSIVCWCLWLLWFNSRLLKYPHDSELSEINLLNGCPLPPLLCEYIMK